MSSNIRADSLAQSPVKMCMIFGEIVFLYWFRGVLLEGKCSCWNRSTIELGQINDYVMRFEWKKCETNKLTFRSEFNESHNPKLPLKKCYRTMQRMVSENSLFDLFFNASYLIS